MEWEGFTSRLMVAHNGMRKILLLSKEAHVIVKQKNPSYECIVIYKLYARYF